MEIPRDAAGRTVSMGFREQNLYLHLQQLERQKAQILKEGRRPSKSERHQAQEFLNKTCLVLEFRALAEIRQSAKRGWGLRPDRGRQYRQKINELSAFFRD